MVVTGQVVATASGGTQRIFCSVLKGEQGTEPTGHCESELTLVALIKGVAA